MDRLGFLFSQAPLPSDGPAVPVRTSSQKLKPVTQAQRMENLKALHAKSQSMPECSMVPELQKAIDMNNKLLQQQQQQQQLQLQLQQQQQQQLQLQQQSVGNNMRPQDWAVRHAPPQQGPRTVFHAHLRQTWNQDGPILEVEENSTTDAESPVGSQPFVAPPRNDGNGQMVRPMVRPMIESKMTRPNVQEARVRTSMQEHQQAGAAVREKPAVPHRTSPVQSRTSLDDSSSRLSTFGTNKNTKPVDLGVRAHTLDSRHSKKKSKAPKVAPRPASYQKLEMMDGEPDLEEKLLELLENSQTHQAAAPDTRPKPSKSGPPMHSTPMKQPSFEELRPPSCEPIPRSDSPKGSHHHRGGHSHSPRLGMSSNSMDSTIDDERGYGFNSTASDPTLTSVSSLDTMDMSSRLLQSPTSPRGIPSTIAGKLFHDLKKDFAHQQTSKAIHFQCKMAHDFTQIRQWIVLCHVI